MTSYKTILTAAAVTALVMLNSCSSGETEQKQDSTQTESTAGNEELPGGGQASVVDNDSEKDIVKVAVGSKDHTTLVKAVQAAELVDVLSSSGPYTVFAPINTAFEALPAGTVEGLLKPEKKNDLADILQYHVTVPVLTESMFRDGQSIGMANGKNAKVSVKDGKIKINDANIIGTVKASNGIIYVIDKVLLPGQ